MRQKRITEDQSKDILNSILNEDVLSDSDSEEPISPIETRSHELIGFCHEIKVF